MADQFDDRYSSPDAVRLAKSLAVPRAGREARPASYRRATTPQMLAQNAYYPEDENRDVERQRLLENNFMDYYRQNLSPEAIRKLTFEYARNELGMSERDAAIQADHAASTATRTGYIADATVLAPLAGGAVNFGREAIKTAEAMAAPRVAGAAAPRAAINPATDFRLAAEQSPRIGPNRPPEARNPVIDEMYDPTDLYLGREGNRLRTGTNPNALERGVVSREVDPIARLNAESPRADRVLATEQQAGRDAEAAFRQRQAAIAEEEGFGRPMTQSEKDFAQFQRELAATEERGAGNQFTPPAAAGEPTSPLLNMPAPGVKRRLTPAAEPVPAQPTFDFGGPQSVGGQMVDPLTGRAYMPRQFPQSADSLIDQAIADATGDVSRQSAIDRAKQRFAAQSAAEEAPAVARPAAAGEAPAAAAAPASAASRGFGDKALIGGSLAALGLAGATADRDERRQQKALAAAQSRQIIDDMDEAAFRAARNASQPFQTGTASILPANLAVDPNFDAPAALPAASRPAQNQPPGNAPATRSPPAQMPAAPAGGGSFLDKIFSGKDYQSSGGQLQQQQGGNRVLNWGDSDNAADFFRADAMRKRMEDQKQQYTGRSGSDIDYENRMAASQSEGEGKARGGAAQQKPSKEAMLHKSLEIIHHMIRNR